MTNRPTEQDFRTLMAEEKNVVLVPDQEQKFACMQICHAVEEQLTFVVLFQVREDAAFEPTYLSNKREVNVAKVAEHVLKNCIEGCEAFLELFLET